MRIEDAPEIFQKHLTEEEQQVYLALTEEMLKEYKEMFEFFDNDSSGYLSNAEIYKVIQGVGENIDQAKVDEMIVAIDFDRNGEVDFEEFLVLMVKTLTINNGKEEELVLVFRRFDTDGDGEINW